MRANYFIQVGMLRSNRKIEMFVEMVEQMGLKYVMAAKKGGLASTYLLTVEGTKSQINAINFFFDNVEENY